ncbi:hypothetical protein ACHAPU_001776 [Fusarium lateritium]
MAHYFQPPIFGNYLLPAAPSVVPSTLVVTLPYNSLPLYWQPAPVLISAPRYVTAPTTRIKVIFHRAGTILGSNDAYYNYLPTREAVLGNLAWWSQGHGLEDRVYSGQWTGPVTPLDTLRKVPFAEQLPTGEFQSLMDQIATNGYGAFILVDFNSTPTYLFSFWHRKVTKAQFAIFLHGFLHRLLQHPLQHPLQTTPPPSNPPSRPASTSEPQRSNTGNSTRSPLTAVPGTPDSKEPEDNHTQVAAQSVDGIEPQSAGGDGGVANG